MKIDEVDFNPDWVASHSKEEFVKEFMAHDHIFPGAGKTAKLEEAYALIKKSLKQAGEEDVPQSVPTVTPEDLVNHPKVIPVTIESGIINQPPEEVAAPPAKEKKK